MEADGRRQEATADRRRCARAAAGLRFFAALLGLLVLPALPALLPAARAAPEAGAGTQVLRVGSKRFTESTILGEILAQAARPHAKVEHVPGIGNTAIVYTALKAGSIDLYPEYLGTIELEILHHPRTGASLAELDRELAAEGLGIAVPFGFENRYAIGVRGDSAPALSSTSGLAAQPLLRGGLSHEFLGRTDGWPGLASRYGLRNPVQGLDHGIAFEALAGGQVDFIDIYSTDAKIGRYSIRVLDDDLHYFPRYDAVVMYRLSVPQRFPAAWAALLALSGRIDAARMVALNAQAEQGRPADEVARGFLAQTSGQSSNEPARQPGFFDRLFAPDFGRLARQHLGLVLSSVAAATLAGVPLGILAARRRWAGAILLPAAGILQTIPALALLAALIPVVGSIGAAPTRIALFLFALLPIMRNTAVGLAQVPRPLREAATALGARAIARLWFVELPLAAPVMLAGIRTATVISVGTATIGAFVGAGGFGERISIGLALNDGTMLLAGALPAAALALAFELMFAALERALRTTPLPSAPGKG
jgi:osmoprotectant transport system permease protein